MPSIETSYKEDINFALLAEADADFAKILKPNSQLDFNDPAAVIQLTKSLLKRDFNLKLELPPNRLCPPVPSRLNYILWIKSLLESTSPNLSASHDPSRQIVGLDIGTGASCIYPLLACSLYPQWRFIGTDIDELSFSYAEQNVYLNGISARIALHKTEQVRPMLAFDDWGVDTLDFQMTNPPFYESAASLAASSKLKKRPPNSVCTGSESEMIYPGGEIAFITRLIQESLVQTTRIQWYSTLLGLHSSLTPLLTLLHSHNITNTAITEFTAGSRTRRWGLAWSFQPLRPSVATSRNIASLPKALLPFPTEYVVELGVGDGGGDGSFGEKIDRAMADLPLLWLSSASSSCTLIGQGFCNSAVWSRSARRQALKASRAQQSDEATAQDLSFGFRISLLSSQDPGQIGGDRRVLVRWLKGDDSVLFESLCGMVRRLVTS